LNAFTTDFSWTQLLAGLALAVGISAAATAARSLSRSGAVAATVLGTVSFGLGGLPWAVLLVGFFVSSSVLSRLFQQRKSEVNEKFSKGGRRDAGQVLANGGAAGILVIAQALFPAAWVLWLAGAGSLAAVNADTWATELGVLSRKEPRLLTTGQKVEKGTSGAVSGYGILAAVAGAAAISLLALVVWPSYARDATRSGFGLALLRLAVITLAGVAGSLVDSLLGATVQAIYYCPACGQETERHPLHSCGTPTHRVRGWSWLNNDGVNWMCALTGALAGLVFAAIL
jgi:uncharacterized protein (TIGR00297 family)